MFVVRKEVETATSQSNSWTSLLLAICLTSTLGTTLPVGYFLGVLNAPAVHIHNWCKDILPNEYDSTLSDSEIQVLWASIVSIYFIGGIFGSCFSAWCCERYGRKGTLLISCVIFIVAAICFGCCREARSLEMLLTARFLGGIASALVLTAHPTYLYELAPITLSGNVGVFTGIGVTVGIFMAQIISLPQLLGTEELWPFALCSYCIPVMLCMLPIVWFPESPRFLYINKGNEAGSELALRRLRGMKGADNILIRLDEKEATLKSASRPTSLCKVIRNRVLLLPLLLVCSLQATQQLSIGAIFYYSISTYTQAGYSNDMAVWLNFGAGFFNTCISLPASLWLYSFPRRPLILISCGSCSLILLFISLGLHYINDFQWIAYGCVVFILSFVLCFQIGLGPIPFFIGSELLEDAPRPVAMSLSSLFSWLGNLLMGMYFPLLQEKWGSFAFLPSMCICFYCLLLAWLYLPETQGRDPKDVN